MVVFYITGSAGTVLLAEITGISPLPSPWRPVSLLLLGDGRFLCPHIAGGATREEVRPGSEYAAPHRSVTCNRATYRRKLRKQIAETGGWNSAFYCCQRHSWPLHIKPW